MRTLLEMAFVLALGTGTGLLVNAFDERGLQLSRQYFPRSAAQAGAGMTAGAGTVAPAATAQPALSGAAAVASDGPSPERPPEEAAPPAEAARSTPGTASAGDEADAAGHAAGAGGGAAAVAARLASKGLTGIGFDEAAQAWRDPLRELGAIVFVDARDQAAYEQGHIPGALKLDFYQPGDDLAALVPLLPGAQRVVVYCNGGQCEDSESTALLLLGLGADPATLAVYAGGITEWRARGMPVATGPFPESSP